MCEEDTYLLELIRYIHLNPLRAGLVKDLQELDKYPWTGHSAILGRRKNPLVPEIRGPKSEAGKQAKFGQVRNPNSTEETTLSVTDGLTFSLSSGNGRKQQNNPDNPACPVKFRQDSVAYLTGINRACPVEPGSLPGCSTGVKNEKPLAEKTIEDILLHFGESKRVAIKRYRDFVEKGIKQGTREDLQGGGLVGVLVETRQVFSAVKWRKGRRETQGFWEVAISLRQRSSSLKNCLKENMDQRKVLMI